MQSLAYNQNLQIDEQPNPKNMQPTNNIFYSLPPYAGQYSYYPQNSSFSHPILFNSTYHQYKLVEQPSVNTFNFSIQKAQSLYNSSEIKYSHQSSFGVSKQAVSIIKFVNSEKRKAQPKDNKISKPLVIEQKEGRNSTSNLLRMFFRHLYNKIQNNPYQILYIIKKLQMRIALQQFIDWVRQKKIDHRNYIRVPAIKKLFVEEMDSKQHTKLIRVLLKYFLEEESMVSYLTSKKVKKASMVHNYRSVRSIFKDIFSSKPNPK